jgi:hypothetical protein
VGYQVGALLDPNGTGLSTNSGPLALGDFMSIDSNDGYPGVPDYQDSLDAPWDGVDAGGADDPEELRMLRGLHRANVGYHCDSTTREDLFDMRQRCLNETGSTQEAACAVCEEFSARHIRVGCGPDDYVEEREPICNYASATPEDVEYLYWNMSEEADLAQDAADIASEFCRDEEDYNIGPCVSVYAFGSYENAYCAAMWYPYFYCSSCSSCSGIGTALAINDSGWDEADLTIQWTSTDAYFGNSTDWSTALIYSGMLWPPTCFYTDYGYALVEAEVCDPYGNCSWDWDSTEFSCYGAAY